MTDQTDFLTVQEAATILGVDHRALLDRARRGKIPSYRHPFDERRILIKRDDLAVFLKEPEPIERKKRK